MSENNSEGIITLVVVFHQHVEVHICRTFHNHYFGCAHQFCTFFLPYIYCIDSVCKKIRKLEQDDKNIYISDKHFTGPQEGLKIQEGVGGC